jgi:hypothetical protein
LEEFPSIKVTTKYGSIVLPKASDFYFKGVDLTTEESDLVYDAIQSSSLALQSKTGQLRLTGPAAHYMRVVRRHASILVHFACGLTRRATL